MVLIVGGNSKIGGAVYRMMKARGSPVAATTRRYEHVAPERPFLDLAAPLNSWEPPPHTRAACVCAAVARIAACATDSSGSAYVNVNQTLALTENSSRVASTFCSSRLTRCSTVACRGCPPMRRIRR